MSQSVTTFVGQWLASKRPEELASMAERDSNLTDQLRPFSMMIKPYKRMVGDFDISADSLLDYCLANYPDHGLVLMEPKTRSWYKRQIDELRSYIQSL